MRVCFDLVKAGEADAVVSAGNSGRDDGVRPVRARAPARRRAPRHRHDVSRRRPASARCSTWAPTSIRSRACSRSSRVLGSVYARLLHGKSTPRVGLLSNGSEEHKGTPLTRDAHQLLSRPDPAGDADFTYVGYVEGRDIFRGQVDVVVTDGFTGNVVLKSVEGAAEVILDMVREEVARAGLLSKLGAALMTGALKKLRRRTDYAEHGGAPLLGVDGVALICHGGSNAMAIKNAVLRRRSVRPDGPAHGADRRGRAPQRALGRRPAGRGRPCRDPQPHRRHRARGATQEADQRRPRRRWSTRRTAGSSSARAFASATSSTRRWLPAISRPRRRRRPAARPGSIRPPSIASSSGP